MKRALLVILEGITISLLIIFASYFFLPEKTFDTFKICGINGFARRWGGSCSGWYDSLVIEHTIAELLHFIAYTTMSIVVYRLHPKMKSYKQSGITIILTSAFIFGCGITHLLGAYTNFDPIYELSGMVKLINGIISVTAMFYVSYGLVRASWVANKRNKDLADFQKRLNV